MYTDRQTDRLTDRQTDWQTDTELQACVSISTIVCTNFGRSIYIKLTNWTYIYFLPRTDWSTNITGQWPTVSTVQKACLINWLITDFRDKGLLEWKLQHKTELPHVPTNNNWPLYRGIRHSSFIYPIFAKRTSRISYWLSNGLNNCLTDWHSRHRQNYC